MRDADPRTGAPEAGLQSSSAVDSLCDREHVMVIPAAPSVFSSVRWG